MSSWLLHQKSPSLTDSWLLASGCCMWNNYWIILFWCPRCWCPLDSEELWCGSSIFLPKALGCCVSLANPVAPEGGGISLSVVLLWGGQFSQTVTLWGEGVQLAMPSLCSKEKPHFTLKPQKCALGFVGWSLFWKFHGQNQQSCGRRLCGVACSGSSVLSFQVSRALSKASGLLRDLVWVSFKWCPWTWLVFPFHSNIHYKAFLLGNLPVKGAKLKGWKANSFMHFGDTKPSNVFIGPDLRFQTCGCWTPGTSGLH